MIELKGAFRRGGRLSRRVFVKGAGIAVAGSALAPLGVRALLGAGAAPRDPLQALSREAFAAYVGQRFRVRRGAAGDVEVVLTTIEDRRQHLTGSRVRAHHGGESFALVFRGPAGHPLSQDTYRFEHRALGAFPLFIVPGHARTDDAMQYTAEFNRLPA